MTFENGTNLLMVGDTLECRYGDTTRTITILNEDILGSRTYRVKSDSETEIKFNGKRMNLHDFALYQRSI